MLTGQEGAVDVLGSAANLSKNQVIALRMQYSRFQEGRDEG